jgi:hypothetical protein
LATAGGFSEPKILVSPRLWTLVERNHLRALALKWPITPTPGNRFSLRAAGFRGLFDVQTVDERSRTGPDEYPRDLFEAYWAQVGNLAEESAASLLGHAEDSCQRFQSSMSIR